MESYTNFAYVYDTFMDNVPYDEWCKYLVMLLKQYGVDDGIVLDMGCGTGNMTSRLCQLGYDMIGIDNSEDMLAIARENAGEKAYEYAIHQRIFFCRILAAILIHHIAKAGKNKIRKAQRRNQIQLQYIRLAAEQR